MGIKRSCCCLVLLIMELNLVGQTDMRFNYMYSDEFKKPVFSQVFLTFPNGKVEQLYRDTSKISEIRHKNYFCDTGEYSLRVVFESKELKKKSSIVYTFELNGEEADIDITVCFCYNNTAFYGFLAKPKQMDKKKIAKGYIYVIKYYESGKNISIHLSDIESSEEDAIQGPFFTLVNNSKDTFTGLDGYFGGILGMKMEDASWAAKIETIDRAVNRCSLLYPDSTAIATVGTWGYMSKLPKNQYLYDLLYTVYHPIVEICTQEQKRNFYWYTHTKTLYRLQYEFEIE